MAKATWKPHLSNAAEPNGYSPVAALQRSLAGGLWPFKLLSGVIRPEKLGIDPTLQAMWRKLCSAGDDSVGAMGGTHE
jgi:hypothetical protein